VLKTNEVKPKFYETNWFMWLTLILFSPVGIVCMWKYKRFPDTTRKILTAVFSLYFVGMMMYVNRPSYTEEQQAQEQAQEQAIEKQKAIDDQAAAQKKDIADAKQKQLDDQRKSAADKMNSDVLYFSQVKGKEIFGARFINAEILEDGGIVIHFKLSENLSLKLVGNGGFLDSSKMLAAYKGRTDYTDVSCQGTYRMADKFGNKTDDTVFILTLDKYTIQKTAFENIVPITGLLTLANVRIINPELTN